MKPFILTQNTNMKNLTLDIIKVSHLIDKNHNNVSVCNFGIDEKPILLELSDLKIINIQKNTIHVLLDEKTKNMLMDLDDKIYTLIDSIITYDAKCVIELKETLNEIMYSSLIKKNTNDESYLQLFMNEDTSINMDLTCDSIASVVFILRDLCIKPKDGLCCVRNVVKNINVQTEYKEIVIDLTDYTPTETKQLFNDNIEDFKTLQDPYLNDMNDMNDSIKNESECNASEEIVKPKRKYNKKSKK